MCPDTPITQRLDEADAALVGRIVAERPGRVEGARVTTLTVEIDQRVKRKLASPLQVRSPRGSDADVDAPLNETVGFLLDQAPDGAWLASRCSVVRPGPLVAAGDEPRGGVIKVGIGFLILVLVLTWALRRLRRGARPDLPGAPRP